MSTLNVIHQRILTISLGKDVAKNIAAYFAVIDSALEASFESFDLIQAKEVLLSADRKFANKRPEKRVRKNDTTIKARKPPICGWILFLRHTVEELKASNFEDKLFTKVSELWNALDVADKQIWKDKASVMNAPQVMNERKKPRIQESSHSHTL